MAGLHPVDEPIYLREHDPRWRSWFVDERDRLFTSCRQAAESNTSAARPCRIWML